MKIGVVIATRNNEDGIKNLLKSLEICISKPDQISIVSSGRNIESTVNLYKNALNITYENSDVTGQVPQRALAISKIIDSVEVILFLDDDVLVDKLFFDILKNDFKRVGNEVWGMGTQFINSKQQVFTTNKFKRFSQLQSNIPGRVLKSGANTPYQRAEKFSQTQWLNGLSIWRCQALKEYEFPKITGAYAASEDLIFSYRISKAHTLLTNNELLLYAQSNEHRDQNILNRVMSQFCHFYYFVYENKELSIFLFFINFFLTYTKAGIRYIFTLKTRNLKIFLALNMSITRIIKFHLKKLLKDIEPDWLFVK